MLNKLIVGASGYAGAELVTYVTRHPHMNITALTVSAQSNDAGKLISDLHRSLALRQRNHWHPQSAYSTSGLFTFLCLFAWLNVKHSPYGWWVLLRSTLVYFYSQIMHEY